MTVPGALAVVFDIEAEHPDLGRVVRTQTVSVNVQFGLADITLSAPRLEEIQTTADGRRVALHVQPKDEFGNFLGPDVGHRLKVNLDVGRVETPVEDLGDGRYIVRLLVPEGVDPQVNMTVMGEPFFGRKLSDYGQASTDTRPVWMLVLAILIVLAIVLWSTRH